MGAVYEAVHTGTGRRVAVKVLHHHAAHHAVERERFVREARFASAIASPYAAQVFDAGTDHTSGLPYMAMELVEGLSLRQLLTRRRRLPQGLVLVIAVHVVRGLAEVHRAGVIHRDVKPANVMLSRDREGKFLVKLVDFGVARSVSGDTITTEGLVGSLPYMSPEQMRGERLDPTTDLWSLGALMYEALSGERAAGNNDAIGELVRRVCHEEPLPLTQIVPEMSSDVSRLVQKAMSRDRAQRFSSAREMERAFLEFLPLGASVSADVIEDGSEIFVATKVHRDSFYDPRARCFWGAAIGLMTMLGAFSAVVGMHPWVHAEAIQKPPSLGGQPSGDELLTAVDVRSSVVAPVPIVDVDFNVAGNMPTTSPMDPVAMCASAARSTSLGVGARAPVGGLNRTKRVKRSRTATRPVETLSDNPLDHM